jgi:two-component system phosphate regulon sensor histidine kinase PhoR
VAWALAALGGAGLALPGHPVWSGVGLVALVVSAVILFRLPGDPRGRREGGPPGAPSWDGGFGPGLLAQLQEGIVVLGSQGEIQHFNLAAQNLLGRSSRLEAGAAQAELFREPESLRNLESAYAGLVAEWTLRREPRVLRVRALPLEQEGLTPGVLVTLDDVTRLEALETTRQKFISNASHELKTPVTSIRIAAEGLLDSSLTGPEERASLESVLRSVTKLTLLLDDISELSRIETGALRLEFVEIELDSFLESLRQDFGPTARVRALKLVIEAAPDLAGARFRSDATRLQQMLDNLLGNALKFSPEGTEVALKVVEEGPWLRWDISDQGPGIATGDLRRIFERFYRSPAVRGVPGTGLGLAIVKHLAWQMGGEVSVASELGRGSTFTLRLPR